MRFSIKLYYCVNKDANGLMAFLIGKVGFLIEKISIENNSHDSSPDWRSGNSNRHRFYLGVSSQSK
jgi:hypothetical protein